jgi:hypothetical protein
LAIAKPPADQHGSAEFPSLREGHAVSFGNSHWPALSFHDWKAEMLIKFVFDEHHGRGIDRTPK